MSRDNKSKNFPKGRKSSKGSKGNGRNSENKIRSRKHNQTGSSSNKKHKLEIKFDPASRRDYISGLSSRKQQRRTFGLAMQKVKDRQKRLEERKEVREAQIENIEERERQQEAWLNSQGHDSDSEDDESDNDTEEPESAAKKNSNGKIFDIVSNTTVPSADSPHAGRDVEADLKTTTSKAVSDLHGGRSVTITTTFGLPERDSSDEEDDKILEQRKKRKRLDEGQREAGNVKHYIKQLKGNLPSKKSKFAAQRKGNHGASNMHGMGGAASLKAAKRTLLGAEKKLTGRSGISALEGKGKRKGKRGKR